MISIIKSSPRVRRFCVYDLEWVPETYKLRVCGVFDPWNGYRHYNTIKDFLRFELTPSSNGMWFYAHFGGGADLQFVIEEIIKDDTFSVQGFLSASSCVRCQIKHGKWNWHFCDSFYLLRSPLAEIAKWIGEEKTGPKTQTDAERKEWYANVDEKILIEYNRNDCEVLWRALAIAQDTILELGGQMQMTLAATGLQLFRRKYLTSDVATSSFVNQNAKNSYFASRVEVFQKDVNYSGKYYDVNSSFPFAMTFPLPGALFASYHNRMPDIVWDFPFIADCTVTVPDTYLPPLPFRLKERVFFPTGEWRGKFTSIDLRLLLENGGTFKKCHEVQVFRPFDDLANYAKDLYARRAKTTNPFEREFYKLLLNSLYGKFAEQADKTTLIINPTGSVLSKLDRLMDMLFPGVFLHTSEVMVPHAHVPISAYITAIARRTLFNFMAQAEEIHYCDTDGFSTISDFPTEPGLGGLKLEKEFSSATFLVPKLYSWQPADCDKPPVVKAKGFSLSKDPLLARQSFDKLVMGGEVTIERMSRIRENMRRKVIHPHDTTITKRLRQLGFLESNYEKKAIPKRFMYPDGYTRAWTIEELI